MTWDIVLRIWLYSQSLSLLSQMLLFYIIVALGAITSPYWGFVIGFWIADKRNSKMSKKEVSNVS